METVIQCVPNFSEGRRRDVVEAVVRAARDASAARVIDYSSDPDHNRMVVTLLGGPEEIRATVFAAASQAIELIDMRVHQGAHPRVGAVDVVPLVPVQGISMDECIEMSRLIGRDFADKLGIPVYFYERSAITSCHVNLPNIRRGGYEHLSAAGTLDGDLKPDLGPQKVHPSAGAVVIGARGPLIAYNVNLKTDDMSAARAIVKKIRSGEAGFDGVRSMSVLLASRGKVQVSMNITRPAVTPLRDVYRFVELEAGKLGIEVAESEIIGALRLHHLDGISPQELKARDFKDSQIIDNWLAE